MNRNRRKRVIDGENDQAQLEAGLLGLLNEADKLGALTDTDVYSLFRSAKLGGPNTAILGAIRRALQPYQLRNTIDPNPLRPQPAEDSGLQHGDISIGEVFDTQLKYRMRGDEPGSIILTGRTGSGKSSILRIVFCGWSHDVPVVLFATKPETRDLIQSGELLDTVIMDTELKFSLFQPIDGSDPAVFQYRRAESVCRTFGLEYARSEFQECVRYLASLYRRYSKRQGATHTFTLTNVKERAIQSKSKYKQSLISALSRAIDSTYRVFEYSRGISIPSLFRTGRKGIVVGNIADIACQRLLLDTVSDVLFLDLVAHGPSDGSVQLRLVSDDCHPLYSTKVEQGGFSSIAQNQLIWRQAGIRELITSQMPSDLSMTILSQASVIINVGPLVHNEDVRTMANALGMRHGRNEEFVFQKLQPQEFVARDPRYSRPFMGRVHDDPYADLPHVSESVRAEGARQLLTPFDVHPSVPLAHVEAAVNRVEVTTPNAMTVRKPSADAEASELGVDILKNPFDSQESRRKRLEWNTEQMKRAKACLLGEKFVRRVTVPHGKGRPKEFLEPMPALAKKFSTPMPSWGRGGFVHRYGQLSVRDRWVNLGYNGVEIECRRNGKDFDVFAVSPEGPAAAEITVHLTNCVDQAVRDFEAVPDLHLLLFICFSTSDKRQISRLFRSAPELDPHRNRIVIQTLGQFLKSEEVQ